MRTERTSGPNENPHPGLGDLPWRVGGWLGRASWRFIPEVTEPELPAQRSTEPPAGRLGLAPRDPESPDRAS